MIPQILLELFLQMFYAGYNKVRQINKRVDLFAIFAIILVMVINLFLLDRTVQNKMQPYSYQYVFLYPNGTFNALQAFVETPTTPSIPPNSTLQALNQQPQLYSSINLFNNQTIPPHPFEKLHNTTPTFYPYPSPPPIQSPQPKRTDITPKYPQKPPQSLVLDSNVYKYPKKNAQSNLINQIVSFLSIPSKSNLILLHILGSNIKVTAFYEVMKLLKRKSKKYINRAFLRDLLLMETSHIIHGILQKIRIEPLLESNELRIALRKLVFYFLEEKCVMTILTSAKLDRFTFNEHLKRRRQVLKYLHYHLRSSIPQPPQPPLHSP